MIAVEAPGWPLTLDPVAHLWQLDPGLDFNGHAAQHRPTQPSASLPACQRSTLRTAIDPRVDSARQPRGLNHAPRKRSGSRYGQFQV
jgi:hypothetical protein